MEKLKLTISDPFDFPLNALEVAVQDRQDSHILLVATEPILYKKQSVHQFLVTPRDSKESIAVFSQGKSVDVNITPILSNRDLSLSDSLQFEAKWRGWFLLGLLSEYQEDKK